ncbi:LysM peptidoglycan-binding domain-containing protein [Nicoliella spurrieriana]|uniref:aggregation-promoting factor n=1 Tax=Nicoliella spurrieriana TaxID=2925830 RepID=UPI003C6E2E49
MLRNKNLKRILASTTVAAGLFVAGVGAVKADASTRITVQSGDTLWAIAREYNVDLQSLESANNLNDNSVIYVGQSLTLPDNGNTASTTNTTANTQSAVQTSGATQSSYNNQSNVVASSNNTTTAASSNTTATTAATSGDSSSAKAWIANRESGGSYTATNGQYVGKYQLSSSYLNGDYSAANQERVADSYVASRYGSWDAAKAFWQSHGWY